MSHLISVEQLIQLENVQILEVGEKTADPLNAARALDLYQANHITDAQYVDLNLQFSKQTGSLKYQCPSLIELKNSFKQLKLNWAKPIVIYDRGNHIWAARLWWILSAYGHTQCYVLHGGWQAWLSAQQNHADLRFKQRLERHSQQYYFPDDIELNPNRFAKLDDVIDISKYLSEIQLINVLRKPVFDGTELSYHRAGHIPNSRNIPFSNFLDENGRFQTIDSAFLQQHFLEISKDIILYCGSGVTASGAALALIEAGARAVKIYDGSMDEWSANPSLPLILSTE